MTVCLAAEGYGYVKPHKGDEIFGLDKSYDGVTVQQAGVRAVGNKVVTNGGRVAYISSAGKDIDEATTKAYAAIGKDQSRNGVYFRGMQHRTDIGWQARSANPNS